MKKITVYCSILLALGVLASAAAAQTQINRPKSGDITQLPKPTADGKKIVRIVVADDNFEPQKYAPPLAFKPGIAYEVWITTDGVLHCKTNSTLKSASIKFTPPERTSKPDANGNTTSSGGDFSRKFDLNKPEGSDAYAFDIAADKYKEKHAVTLTITSTNGSKAEIKLTNKKVPAKIVD